MEIDYEKLSQAICKALIDYDRYNQEIKSKEWEAKALALYQMEKERFIYSNEK